jgi:hypothetical protein
VHFCGAVIKQYLLKNKKIIMKKITKTILVVAILIFTATSCQKSQDATPAVNGPTAKSLTDQKTEAVAKEGTIISIIVATEPPPQVAGKGRWVTRVSYKACPIGTTPYVADDGGVRCWAGPN